MDSFLITFLSLMPAIFLKCQGKMYTCLQDLLPACLEGSGLILAK